ncbi:MAG: polysaccharide biosynthesis protein [Clostridia bacterium]|nr:polysaccharide biosynthesis protein [Clostridia bacterium]
MFYDGFSSVLSLILATVIIDATFRFGILAKLSFWYVAVAAFVSVAVINYAIRLYMVVWRFATLFDYVKVAASAFVISCIVALLSFRFSGCFENRKVAVSSFFIFLAFFQLVLRLAFHRHECKVHCRHDEESSNKVAFGNVLVIGGGSAASKFITEFADVSRTKTAVRCVVDDDVEKQGKLIGGIPVVGGRDKIPYAVKKYDINTIVFAIPSCPKNQKASIMRICQMTKCKLYTMPSLYQMLQNGSDGVTTVREVQIEDLLGREVVSMNIESVMNYVRDRVVMVTGGGGSIGSELCRQLAANHPKQLIIFDIYENNAYDIQNELKRKYPDLDLVTLIGSVRDTKRLNCVFGKYHPEIVYHAAAHKHVPLMEDSPNETLKNNVFGTYKTALCAAENGVKKFVLISTDKAVNPTNIMGASKRICEMIIQTLNNHYDTEFVAVRFGNVLGSNGSVIPLFKKQIANGGPVTVTDPDIIRYFMTIPEATSLVLQAGATAKGGEIFVLDMGKPVRILDLAENLIKLSGFEPYVDIDIQFTGLRPGEKLYEEMLMSEEGLKRTDNELIYIGHPISIDEELFNKTLAQMKVAMYDESIDVRALVKQIVPTYQYTPSGEFVTA